MTIAESLDDKSLKTPLSLAKSGKIAAIRESELAHSVLIVEDEPNIADALSFILQHAGFSVSVESDGARALDTISAGPVDVVVLDVMLPNRSGFDILRDLRQGGRSDLPVLMLTAKGQAQDRKTANELGVTAFMTKPFSNAEVVETVRRLAETA